MGRKELFWAAVGAIASIVAVFLTIYGFYFTRHEASKEVEATVLSRSRILNADLHKRSNDLKLLYKDSEISNASIFQVRIRNSGAQPIAANEIERPIQIQLLGAVDIISAAVVSARPPLPITVEIRPPGDVIVSKALLNPDDMFVVEIVTVDDPKVTAHIFNVIARIAGVKNVVFHEFPPDENSRFFTTDWRVSLALLAMIASTITSVTRWLLQQKYERHRKES